jgi:hypothetical protein
VLHVMSLESKQANDISRKIMVMEPEGTDTFPTRFSVPLYITLRTSALDLFDEAR